MSEDHQFSDAPISRRRFFQLSAATGAALALPGNAAADAEAEAFTAEYQYVLNHTPTDHAVPTLVRRCVVQYVLVLGGERLGLRVRGRVTGQRERGARRGR